MDAALDCVICMDHKGVVLEFNAAAEQTFGYTRDDAIGRPLAELIIPEEKKEQHRNGLAEHLRTGVKTVLGRRIEAQARRANGSLIP